MEKLVLTIGGLFETYTWSDLFFFIAVVVLLLLLVYIIYLIKIEDMAAMEDMEEDENQELSSIVKHLDNEYKPEPVDLTDYELEQENTAIISYDELVKRTNNSINYEDNYDAGFKDVEIKKIDPTNTSNTQELVNLPNVIMMSYESEEAFLKALKTLQSNLIR